MTPRRLASVAGWMVVPYTERGGAFLGEGRWESELSLDPSLEDCSSVLEISSQSVSYLCAVLVLCFHGLRLWRNFVRAQFSSVP